MSTCSSRPGWTIALLDKIGSAEADVPRQILLGTLAQSVVAAASLGGFLEGLLIIVNVGTAVALFPVLERRNEPLALGHVSARLVECTFIAIGIVSILATAPEFFWELSLGIYLMVKGFRPSPVTAGTTAAATPPTREFAV